MLEDKEFERRLVLNQEYLMAYARTLTKTNRSYEPEDLLQDTNLRAWEKRSYYRQDDSISGWLCFMMHNIFINHVLQKRLNIYRDRDNSELPPLIDRVSSPTHNQGEGNILLDLIDEAVSQLEGKDRDIVQRYISGESQGSIGRVYDMKDNAVKQRYFHAIRVVREYLTSKGVEYDIQVSDGTKIKQTLYRKKQTLMEHNIRKRLDRLNK